MGLMDQWGDALVEEGLREAAETFFGARKALENEITVFESRVAMLHSQAREIQSWIAGINCLLGSEENSRQFFRMVGIEFSHESVYQESTCRLQFRRPRSFTRKGLFCKAVWEVYQTLARLIEKYAHGEPYTDPMHPGRTLVTVYYGQVRKQCAELNARILKLNEANRPSESLSFAKRMDPALVQKESITGGGEQTWSLDQDLAFTPLDFDSYDLPNLPDLPVDSKARAAIEACCADIFQQQRAHVDAVLDEVLDPMNKKVCILERA